MRFTLVKMKEKGIWLYIAQGNQQLQNVRQLLMQEEILRFEALHSKTRDGGQ